MLRGIPLYAAIVTLAQLLTLTLLSTFSKTQEDVTQEVNLSRQAPTCEGSSFPLIPYPRDEPPNAFIEILFANEHKQESWLISEVPRYDSALSNEEFIEIAREGKPFVMENMLEELCDMPEMYSDWKAFGNALGDVQLGVQEKLVTVKDFLETMVHPVPGQAPKYAAVQNIERFGGRLKLKSPPYYPEEEYWPKAWLGTKDTKTNLHKDTPDNLILMLLGTKELLMFPPFDYDYLFVDPTEISTSLMKDSLFQWAGVPNPLNLEFKTNVTKFMHFQKAHPVHVLISPGDVLFLPAGWWHYVQNPTSSFMVNFWHKRRPESLHNYKTVWYDDENKIIPLMAKMDKDLYHLISECQKIKKWTWGCDLPVLTDPDLFLQEDSACKCEGDVLKHKSTGVYRCTQLPETCGARNFEQTLGYGVNMDLYNKVELGD